jgi:hypothetical protein
MIRPQPRTVVHNTASTGMPGFLACFAKTAAWQGGISSDCVAYALIEGGGIQSLLAGLADKKGSESSAADLNELAGKTLFGAGAELDLMDHYLVDLSQHGRAESMFEAGVQTGVDQAIGVPTMTVAVGAGAAVGDVPGGAVGYGVGAFATTRLDDAADNVVSQVFDGYPRVVNSINNQLDEGASDLVNGANDAGRYLAGFFG